MLLAVGYNEAANKRREQITNLETMIWFLLVVVMR